MHFNFKLFQIFRTLQIIDLKLNPIRVPSSFDSAIIDHWMWNICKLLVVIIDEWCAAPLFNVHFICNQYEIIYGSGNLINFIDINTCPQNRCIDNVHSNNISKNISTHNFTAHSVTYKVVANKSVDIDKMFAIIRSARREMYTNNVIISARHSIAKWKFVLDFPYGPRGKCWNVYERLCLPFSRNVEKVRNDRIKHTCREKERRKRNFYRKIEEKAIGETKTDGEIVFSSSVVCERNSPRGVCVLMKNH